MKTIVLTLLLVGAAHYFSAHAQPYFVPNATPVSQSMFSPTKPGAQQCNFFVWLPQNNRLWYDLTWASHLSIVPDVDSLIAQTATLLEPLMDSFATDGWVRRVEVDVTQSPAIFRVIAHQQTPRSFTKLEDELVQVKIDQDTLRIKFYEEKGVASFINVLVNNLKDINELPADAGKRSTALIREAIDKHYKMPIKKNPRHLYYAVFNLENGEMVAPDSKNYHAIRSGSDQLEISINKPMVSYARGTAFTGFSLGAAFNYAKTRGMGGSRMAIGVYWEPNFAFGRDSIGKVNGSRNDFLTLRFEEIWNKPYGQFEVMNTFSFGYLIRQSGNYFENNTMKLGISGLAFGKLQLEPELYFNNFFKNVSPGIRMSLRIF